MQWMIVASRHYACDAPQKARLEALGFVFGPNSAFGQFPLVGPVTSVSDYGVETRAVRLDITTYDHLMQVLDTLGTTCVQMQSWGCDGDHAFLMFPAAHEVQG